MKAPKAPHRVQWVLTVGERWKTTKNICEVCVLGSVGGGDALVGCDGVVGGGDVCVEQTRCFQSVFVCLHLSKSDFFFSSRGYSLSNPR